MGSPALRVTGKAEQGRVTVLLETNVCIVQCDRTEVPKPFLSARMGGPESLGALRLSIVVSTWRSEFSSLSFFPRLWKALRYPSAQLSPKTVCLVTECPEVCRSQAGSWKHWFS